MFICFIHNRIGFDCCIAHWAAKPLGFLALLPGKLCAHSCYPRHVERPPLCIRGLFVQVLTLYQPSFPILTPTRFVSGLTWIALEYFPPEGKVSAANRCRSTQRKLAAPAWYCGSWVVRLYKHPWSPPVSREYDNPIWPYS